MSSAMEIDSTAPEPPPQILTANARNTTHSLIKQYLTLQPINTQLSIIAKLKTNDFVIIKATVDKLKLDGASQSFSNFGDLFCDNELRCCELLIEQSMQSADSWLMEQITRINHNLIEHIPSESTSSEQTPAFSAALLKDFVQFRKGKDGNLFPTMSSPPNASTVWWRNIVQAINDKLYVMLCGRLPLKQFIDAFKSMYYDGEHLNFLSSKGFSLVKARTVLLVFLKTMVNEHKLIEADYNRIVRLIMVPPCCCPPKREYLGRYYDVLFHQQATPESDWSSVSVNGTVAVFAKWFHIGKSLHSVYLGIAQDGRGRAVKCVDSTVDAEGVTTRSNSELCILQDVSGEHICKFYHAESKGSSEQKFVLELMNLTIAQIVTQKLKEGSGMSLLDVQSFGHDLLSGLSELSDPSKGHPIIHRDLKPVNVMSVLKVKGSVSYKLIDFDHSKRAGNTAGLITRSGMFPTTMGWMAAEVDQATDGNTTHDGCAVDVFSAGLVWYYFLTLGDHPYGPINNGSDADMRRIQTAITRNIIARTWTTKPVSVYGPLVIVFLGVILSVIQHNPADRVPARHALKHPCVWDPAHLTSLISAFRQCIQTSIKERCDFITDLQQMAAKDFPDLAVLWQSFENQTSPFDPLKQLADKSRRPKFNLVCNSIVSIRNLLEHLHQNDYPKYSHAGQTHYLKCAFDVYLWISLHMPSVWMLMFNFVKVNIKQSVLRSKKWNVRVVASFRQLMVYNTKLQDFDLERHRLIDQSIKNILINPNQQ